MNFETLVGSRLIADIGSALLHSLWQISLVAIGLMTALSLLRPGWARLRYAVSVMALFVALATPIVTFILISTDSGIGQLSANAHLNASAIPADERPSRDRLAPNATITETGQHQNATSQNRFAVVYEWISASASNLPPVAALFWLLGVAVFSLRLVGGVVNLRNYRTAGIIDLDDSWQSLFSALRERVNVRHAVRIYQSVRVQTPIAIGIFKPVILVPAGLFLQMHPRELETIIAHELIHIRRYDPLVNLAQCVIESLLFYHPAVWWISARIRQEREFVADAAVIEIFEGSHVTYARALANLEEIRLRTNQQTPRYATAANGGNFMHRIQRILKIKTEASRANSAWTAGLALLLTSAFLLAVFSFTSSELVNAQQKPSGSRKLAIGFVSIPPLDRTTNAPKDADATARLLIQELKEHKVPATGFLQGGMISDGEKLFPVRANIARMWIDAGFEVGLGGFQHIWLHDSPVDGYIANIEKNERIAKKLIGEMGLSPRYFSYPYLNTGKTLDDRAKVEAWLASRGYTPVKYTFDNQEWMYSYAYDMARNDNDVNTMKEIRTAYLDYMERMFDHFEAYSTELFGRDIPQTMVLTPSRLITDTADDFFAMVTKRAYTFITIDEAQADPAYKTREEFTGRAGISWFERWSMAKGRKLRHEPEVDLTVQRVWDERKKTAAK